MKKLRFILLVIAMLVFSVNAVTAQCSICTKTAAQLGEKSAHSLNSGVIYLMLTPFAIVGFIGYRWWRFEKENNPSE